MVSSSNKVRLQKLLLEHIQQQIEEIGVTVIYCHSELSTLSTGVTNDEFGLKHPEADRMLLYIYAKLRMNNVSNFDFDSGLQTMKATVFMLSYQWSRLLACYEQSLGLKLAMVHRPTVPDATWKVTCVGLYIIVCSVLYGKFPNFPFSFIPTSFTFPFLPLPFLPFPFFPFPFFRFPSIRFPGQIPCSTERISCL